MKLHFKQQVVDEVEFRVAKEFEPDLYKDRYHSTSSTGLEDAKVTFKFQATSLAEKLDSVESNDQTTPFDVEVSFKVQPREEKKFPYELNVTMSGLFVVEDEESKSVEAREEFALIEGVVIIFGAIRDLIFNLSGRSYFGAILLPLFPVQDMVRKEIKNKKSSSHKARPANEE